MSVTDHGDTTAAEPQHRSLMVAHLGTEKPIVEGALSGLSGALVLPVATYGGVAERTAIVVVGGTTLMVSQTIVGGRSRVEAWKVFGGNEDAEAVCEVGRHLAEVLLVAGAFVRDRGLRELETRERGGAGRSAGTEHQGRSGIRKLRESLAWRWAVGRQVIGRQRWPPSRSIRLQKHLFVSSWHSERVAVGEQVLDPLSGVDRRLTIPTWTMNGTPVEDLVFVIGEMAFGIAQHLCQDHSRVVVHADVVNDPQLVEGFAVMRAVAGRLEEIGGRVNRRVLEMGEQLLRERGV